MKKIFFLFLLAVFTAVAVRGQEVIALGGYGYNLVDSTNVGDFYFTEGRVMFGNTFRVGPYASYVTYGNLRIGNNNSLISLLRGEEIKAGLSVDNYGHLSYTYSYYFWLNTGMNWSKDAYQESYYKSLAKNNLLFLSGGFVINDDWKGWFGHNQIMFGYQKPVKSESIASWKDQFVSSTPYNKESLRITLESGVKRIGGNGLNFEPILKAGYGYEAGRDKSYYEFGGGIGLGVYRDWYREIFKIVIFKRNDFGEEFFSQNSLTPSGRLSGEIVFNATSLVKLLTTKK